MKDVTYNTAIQELVYPITFFTAAINYDQESVQGRNMPFHQLLLVLDGEGTMRFGERSFPLKKGCAFFTQSFAPVEYINDSGLVTAFITATGCAIDCLSKSTDNGLLFLENVNVEKYVTLISKLLYDYHSGCDQGELSLQAYSIFVDFLSRKDSCEPKWLNETVKYINLNLGKKLTLAELASRSFVSESKLSHDFKKTFSMSVFEYIMNVRLQHARAILLSAPSIMTKDVAERCGFSSVGYFCKMYKKKFGKTPLEDK